VFFSVQERGGSPTGPDPENRVGDQDIGSPGRPVSSRLQVPGETFPFWSGYGLISTPEIIIIIIIIIIIYAWNITHTTESTAA
jgi:hypothetical protein